MEIAIPKLRSFAFDWLNTFESASQRSSIDEGEAAKEEDQRTTYGAPSMERM